MSLTLAQIFALNPTAVVADTDLFYLVQSPYTPGTDAAITGASLKAAFGTGGTVNAGLINQVAFYPANGNAVSGLATANNGTLITSPTGVPSISSTLPNAVQDNITRLGTITSITTPLGPAFGGTGINNGASTITIGGNFTMSGAFTFTGTLTGNTAVTFPITGTLATTSQIPTGAALTKVDDTNVTLTLGGNPTIALVNAASLTLGWTGQLGLTRGGTAASLTASNGGIVYSNATTLAILAGTATAGQILRSGLSSAPSWSTATYPATAGASGNVLTSDGTNFVSSTPASSAGRLLAIQIFSASGTYTPNAAMATCISRAIAGGGGGGGCLANSAGNNGSGGGGAGAYVEVLLTRSQIIGAGTGAAVTIGAAGAGGAAGANNGVTGGTTSLVANGGAGATLFTCAGGVGGAFSPANGAITPQYNVGGLGGVATVSVGTTIVSSNGEPGGFGRVGGTVTVAYGGFGGNSKLGNGAAPAVAGPLDGNAGSGKGSGGGGSVQPGGSAVNRTGGSGTIGYMVIYEYS